ncbi:hypothetical protein PGTUg99_006686 [Puccinia graminis f. sp. tritici]|uniref:Uncharacterized protein n=1 Tax=Puccinia graminis f. sp. tritici TaxID=56615 RepID=A0A5B0SJS9_PUCGR|nr:hypothetical protein PGTUg99_006686 [Puccinia graminis f. sp. tritici]
MTYPASPRDGFLLKVALVGQDVVDDENWTSKANYLIPQNEDEKAGRACSRLWLAAKDIRDRDRSLATVLTAAILADAATSHSMGKRRVLQL